MAKKLVVSSSPHIKSPENIRSIMVDAGSACSINICIFLIPCSGNDDVAMR